MAPVSVAERQRRWRKRLKAAGEYNKYKAQKAGYSKKYRIKKALQFVVAPCKSGYSSNQYLSRAINKVKKVLPMSQIKKKRELIKNLSKQFNILKEKVTYQKSRLSAFTLELKDTVKEFYE